MVPCRLIRRVLVLAALVSVPVVGATQARWAFSAAFGSGTPSGLSGVENAMRAGGFGESLACPIFDEPGSNCTGAAFPNLKNARATTVLTLRRSIADRYHIEGFFGDFAIGTVEGHRQNAAAGTHTYVQLHQRVQTFALLAGWNATQADFRIGLGPALYEVFMEPSDPRVTSAQSARRFGVAGNFGLSLPQRGRFYVDVQGQIRRPGSAELGPFNVTSTTGGPNGTIPRHSANFNHFVLLFGGGFRFAR